MWLTAGVLAAASASAEIPTGGSEFFGHVFPVEGPHWTRGAIGDFGAPRSGGRVHEGFDVVASCGTPLLAVRGGRVRRAGYDPVLYGNYLLLQGEGEHRSYFYAHLRRAAVVDRGERVLTGERVGAVGATGNARTVGCHLHFEIHLDGEPIDPEAALRRWDRHDRTAARPHPTARAALGVDARKRLANEASLGLGVALAVLVKAQG